jgi:hypothetical protein
MQQWIGRVLASPEVVLDPQPTAQPYSDVNVDRPARFGDGTYLEVAQHEVSTCPPALWSLARITLIFLGISRFAVTENFFAATMPNISALVNRGYMQQSHRP